MKKAFLLIIFAVLTLFSFFPAFAEEHLIIMNLFQDSRSEAADKKMKEAHPELVIEYREMEDRHALTTHFLSMDNEMDIVCFREWDGIKGMYAAMEGALENLAGYPALVRCRNEQFEVWKNYTVGDLWYGVPSCPNQSLFFLNKALFEKTGLPLPDIHWTWDDFWSLAQALEEYNGAHRTRYALLMDQSISNIAAQYAANTVDYVDKSHSFDDGIFYQMMEKWKSLFDRGLIWDYMTDKKQGGIHKESDTLMICMENSFSSSGITAFLEGGENYWTRYGVRLLPQSERLLPSLVTGFELVIPTASEHKDLAVQWLQFYMDAGKTGEIDALCNGGPLYKDAAYLSAIKENMTAETAEKTDLWIYGLEHSRLNPYNELQHAVSVRYWWQLRDGQITTEEYVAACVRFANQYLGE